MIDLPEDDILILFHADCSDGFGAAYAAWKKYKDNALYIAVKHGAEPPSEILNRNVIILDFSYPKPVLAKMEQSAKSILILDHHKSAKEDLDGVPYAIFDMSRSGAGIAWDVFHNVTRPALIDHIEDRDLWNWKVPHSKEILSCLDLLEKDFKQWDMFSLDLESEKKNDIISKGAGIVEYKNSTIAFLCRSSRRMEVCGYDVPVFNSPIHQSEIGNYLSKDEPFAVVWYQDSGGKLLFSLRSRDGGIDVTTIAKQYGGGGHARAAGFSINAGTGNFPPFEKRISHN